MARTQALPEHRWHGRPYLSFLLRLFVAAAPIGAGVATAAVAARLLLRAGVPTAGRWGGALAVSTLTLVLTDRAVRRLLPLAVLLRLSLAFPGEAPSRLKLARRAAGLRDLRARAERARRAGDWDEPARAAEHVLALVAAVEGHDRATRGHSERVRIYTDLIADEMRLAPADKDRLRWAALLHDVGKLAVPRAVLGKPGPLTAGEWDLIHRHPAEGARLIHPLRPWLGRWAAAVEQHHERYDGAGYPSRLAGERICVGARIVAVADCYETMTAPRPYQRPMSPARARAELVRCSGSQFDPRVVRAFLRVSLGRLRLVSGPLSWLAGSPLLRGLEQAAGLTGRAAAAAATAGGAAVLAVVPPVAAPTERPRPPAVARPAPTPLHEVAVASVWRPAEQETEEPAPTADPSPSPEPSASPSPSRSSVERSFGWNEPGPCPRPSHGTDWSEDDDPSSCHGAGGSSSAGGEAGASSQASATGSAGVSGGNGGSRHLRV